MCMYEHYLYKSYGSFFALFESSSGYKTQKDNLAGRG